MVNPNSMVPSQNVIPPEILQKYQVEKGEDGEQAKSCRYCRQEGCFSRVFTKFYRNGCQSEYYCEKTGAFYAFNGTGGISVSCDAPLAKRVEQRMIAL